MTGRLRLFGGALQGLVVWQSTNEGWEEIYQAFPDGVVDAIVGCPRRPGRMFAGVTHDGLYRSEDGGEHWSKRLDGDFRAVAIDPIDPDVIYAGTEPVHLYRSEDGGDHWEELAALLQLPEEVRQHWEFPLPPHLGHVRHIFIHPDDSRTIYLSIEHGGIVRSLDGGRSWEDVSGGIDYLDIHQVSVLPQQPQRYYASTAQGFFVSDDPARGWARSESGFTRDFFTDFVFLPPTGAAEQPAMLIATGDKSPGFWYREQRGARSALFRSLDRGRSWERVGEGLPDDLDPMVWTLSNHPTDPNGAFAGLGEVDRGSASRKGGVGMIYATSDRGATWQKLPIDVSALRVLWAASA
jgi:hypothetical protein